LESRQSLIESFFQTFETNSNSGDVPATMTQFADAFLAGDPVRGMSVVRASDIAQVLPKRKQLFDRLGCRATTLVSLRPMEIGPRFVLAETEWRLTFARNEGKEEDVLASSVFVVDAGVDPFRIVFYLANQDIMAVLRERRILRE